MKPVRQGYVIIELLLVMSSLLIVFGICVVLMHGLLKLDRSGRAHLAEVTTRDRLARRFRIDVRAASRSKPGPGAATPSDRVELDLPDGRVVDYHVREGRIVRVERDGKGQDLSHDSFRLPSKAVPWFQVRQEGSSWLVTLELRAGPVPGEARSLHEPGCEALLGKDLRFVEPQRSAR